MTISYTLESMQDPVDSESPDALHNPDVFELRARLNWLHETYVSLLATHKLMIHAAQDRLLPELSLSPLPEDTPL